MNARLPHESPRLRRTGRGARTSSRFAPPPAIDRWVLSYADFLLLLFALFALLYGTAAWEVEQLRQELRQRTVLLPQSETPLRPLFPSPPLEPVVAAPNLTFAPPVDPLIESMNALRQAVHHLIERGEVSLHRSAAGLELEIRTQVLFPSASADLQPEATTLLWRLAQVLQPLDYPLRVEGFTDNIPINTPIFPSNWELSAARAASVVHVLADAGLPPQRLAAVGYGEFQPVADNNTPEGRARNRRVVIVVVAPDPSLDIPAQLPTR